MNLSPHFTLDELTRSKKADQLGIINAPGPEELAYLGLLCGLLLEPARALVGPLKINSGFRCPRLNAALRSASKTSAHMSGRAADVVPTEMVVIDAFNVLRKSDLPYDQIILEPTWIHLGIAKVGAEPRRQMLVAHPTDHGLVYERITS